jgi:hypothetical protein
MDKYQHQISQECEREFYVKFTQNCLLNIYIYLLIYFSPADMIKHLGLARPKYRDFKSFHKLKIIFWLACIGKVNIILEEHSLVNNKM